MDMKIRNEVARLETLTINQLQDRYAEVFGEATRSYSRGYLVRRIAWRLQAIAEGGLSERALERAAELASHAEMRSTPPKKLPEPPAVVTAPVHAGDHGRLPMPGTILTRSFRGKTIQVLVLPDGRFEFEGKVYRSLSAVARAVSGVQWNGFAFFGLNKKEVGA